MRRYLTTLRWYEDRLCSLSSKWLASLSLVCLAGLSALIAWFAQFQDDLVPLMGERDRGTVIILAGLLLLASAALWLVSICLAALGRRLVLYLKGI